jgi:hypothetical protein
MSETNTRSTGEGGKFLDPEEGCGIFLRNIGLSLIYMSSQPT